MAIMDISVLWFYRYIRDILTDILTQNIDDSKLIKKTYENIVKSKKKWYKKQ